MTRTSFICFFILIFLLIIGESQKINCTFNENVKYEEKKQLAPYFNLRFDLISFIPDLLAHLRHNLGRPNDYKCIGPASLFLRQTSTCLDPPGSASVAPPHLPQTKTTNNWWDVLSQSPVAPPTEPARAIWRGLRAGPDRGWRVRGWRVRGGLHREGGGGRGGHSSGWKGWWQEGTQVHMRGPKDSKENFSLW